MSAIAVVLLLFAWCAIALGVACLIGLFVQAGQGTAIKQRRSMDYGRVPLDMQTMTGVVVHAERR